LRYYVKDRSGTGQKLVSLTPIKSVKAFCLECMDHRFRDVIECSNRECGLHGWREGRNNHPKFLDRIRESIVYYCKDCSDNFQIDNCSLCFLRPYRRYAIDNNKEKGVDNN
jgi:hypothetical protein